MRSSARIPALLLGAALVAAPVRLAAQTVPFEAGRWSVDVDAGLGVPAAVIDEELSPGPAVGAGLALKLSRHLSVRADLDVAFEGGRTFTETTQVGGLLTTRTPARKLFHYAIGLETFLISPRERTWWASALLSGGLTSWTGSPGAVGNGPWPTVGAGLRVGRQLSPRLGVWLGVRAYGFVVSGTGTGTVYVNLPMLAGMRLAL